MINIGKKSTLRSALLGIALSIITGSAFADRPDWVERKQYRDAQQYHYQNNHRYKQYNNQRYNKQYNKHYHGPSAAYRFRDNDRQLIHQYYRDEQRRGKCPKGFSKKKNRCYASGKTKRWYRGQPLAKHTRYYELPNRLRNNLSPYQDDYRYVRVDNDILMVDNVTNLVIDVIENILR